MSSLVAWQNSVGSVLAHLVVGGDLLSLCGEPLLGGSAAVLPPSLAETCPWCIEIVSELRAEVAQVRP